MTRSDSLFGALVSPLLTSAASKAAPNCASNDGLISCINGCFSQRYVLYFEKSAVLSKVKDTFWAYADVAKDRTRIGSIHRTDFIRSFPFKPRWNWIGVVRAVNVHQSAEFDNC